MARRTTASSRFLRAAALITGVVVLGAVGCGSKGADTAASKDEKSADAHGTKKPDGPVEAAGAKVPGVRDDGEVVPAVQWFEGDLEAALAKAESKLVFMEVGAYWCPPCHRLDEETFTDDAFAKKLEAIAVPVHVDAEHRSGPEIVERYHVLAFPSMLVLEPSGVEKGRVVDFVAPEALIAQVERIAEGGNVLAELEAAVESDPEDLEARFALAHAYALSAKKDEAAAQYEMLLVADPDNAKGFASKAVYDRALFITYKLDDDREGAIEAYRELQSRFPDSPETVRAYRKIGRLLNDLNRADEAIASLDAMLEAAPDTVSSYAWFCFREKCHPEKGLAVVTEALADEDRDALDRAELAYLQGELHHQLGDDEAAAASMAQAAELAPKSAFYKRMARRFAEGR